MPWSAEEMLDGQHRRMDIPAKARTAHKGLLQKTLEEALLNGPSCPPDDPIGQGTPLNVELIDSDLGRLYLCRWFSHCICRMQAPVSVKMRIIAYVCAHTCERARTRARARVCVLLCT